MDKDVNHNKFRLTLKARRRRVYFTKEDEVNILKLVIEEDPFLNQEKWRLIADTIKEKRNIEATVRNVREHVQRSIAIFDKDKSKVIARSGQGDPRVQLLTSASELKKYADDNPSLVIRVSRRPYDNSDHKAVGDSAAQQNADTSTLSDEDSEPNWIKIIQKERKNRIFFKEEDDAVILDLVLQGRPFLNLWEWHGIAEEVKKKQNIEVTGRSVRERVSNLLKGFSSEKSQRSEGELSLFDKKLQAVMDLKEYADKNPQLVVKRRKQKPPDNVSTVLNSGVLSLENAVYARQDHGYANKILDHEEVVIEDVADPELSFMTLDAAAGMKCILTGDAASSPTEPSQSLPTPPPATQPSVPTPSATELLNSASKLAMDKSTYEMLVKSGMRFKVLSIKENPKCEEYISKGLALETLKAENERRRLDIEKKRLEMDEAKAKMDLELETKRIKLDEQKLNLMKQCLEQNQMINQSMISLMETMVYKSVLEE